MILFLTITQTASKGGGHKINARLKKNQAGFSVLIYWLIALITKLQTLPTISVFRRYRQLIQFEHCKVGVGASFQGIQNGYRQE